MIANSKSQNVVLWLLLAAMWSSSYTVIKMGVAVLDPIILVTGRLWIGTLIMYLLLRAQGKSLSRNRADWRAYAISGLMGSAIPFFLISYGEQYVDSALASIFMGLAPVATAMFASMLFSDEPMTPMKVLGLTCGFAGIILLVGPSALEGIGQNQIAQAAILIAAFCYAFTTIYVRSAVRRPPLEMATGSLLMAACFTTVMAIFSGASVEPSDLTTGAVGAVLYLGLFSTALANLIYFYLVPRLGATRMSQVNFAVPVGGALLGAILLSEPLLSDRILAMVVICLAIFLVTSKKPFSKHR